MKKILCISILIFILFNIFGASVAFAQEAGTLLPETNLSKDQCNKKLTEAYGLDASNKDGISDPREYFASKDQTWRNDVLACAIITGRIKFWMVPFFIVYLVEFAIGISGLIAILFLVIGGFQYVVGGALETQEQAKKTIQYALMGMGLVLVAWVVVNLIQFLLTI